MPIKRGTKAVRRKTKPTIETTTYGCDMLDLAVGGGAGWGKVINLVGPKSSGKTLLAAELLSCAIKKYGKKLKWFWDDAERGYSFDSEAIWGIPMLPKDPEDYSETVEEWMHNVRTKLQDHIEKKNGYFIYITDSLDAITSEGEIARIDARDEAMEKGTKQKGSYKMEKPKLLSEFFRVLKGDIKGSNCLLVVISQVRANVNAGPFGKKYQRSGGVALDHYALHVIDLKEVEKIKNMHKSVERVTGVTVEAFISKNKLAKPYRKCYFKVLFDYGIDNIDSNICFLYNLITKEGRTKKKINIKFNGKKFIDRKKLIKYIEKNNLEEKIKDMCKKKWDEIEDALSPKERKPKWETIYDSPY